MKKLLVVLVAFTFLLVGCGNTKKDSGSGSGSGEKKSEEKIVLQMGITPGMQSNEYKAVEKLGKLLDEKTDGRVELKIFPDAQLGDDRAMIEQVTAGVLDLGLGESGRFGLWVKEAEIFQMPYVFSEFDNLKKALFETDAGKELVQKIEDEMGIMFVADAYNGTRQTSSNKAINSLEDMKNMKLRVPNAQANIDYATNVGASPTPMAFSEVYLALQTNAVDGQENPLSAIKTSKFYEVQTHIALTNHILNDQGYLVSKKTYDNLPKDIQKILIESIKEAVEYHTELFVNDEKDLISFFEENGVTITKPDVSSGREKMQPTYDRYLSENGDAGKKLYDTIMDLK